MYSENQDDGCRLCSLGMEWACIVKARMTDVDYCSLGNGASVYSQ